MPTSMSDGNLPTLLLHCTFVNKTNTANAFPVLSHPAETEVCRVTLEEAHHSRGEGGFVVVYFQNA